MLRHCKPKSVLLVPFAFVSCICTCNMNDEFFIWFNGQPDQESANLAEVSCEQYWVLHEQLIHIVNVNHHSSPPTSSPLTKAAVWITIITSAHDHHPALKSCSVGCIWVGRWWWSKPLFLREGVFYVLVIHIVTPQCGSSAHAEQAIAHFNCCKPQLLQSQYFHRKTWAFSPLLLMFIILLNLLYLFTVLLHHRQTGLRSGDLVGLDLQFKYIRGEKTILKKERIIAYVESVIAQPIRTRSDVSQRLSK